MAIKKQPEDFIVEEVLDPAWLRRVSEEPGRFAVFLLRKRSLSTPEAVNALARRLGVRPGAVAHAGLKDKHAATVQHVAVRWTRSAPPPDRVDEPQWSARALGYAAGPLTSAAIAANRFLITVRTLTQRSVAEMDAAADLLASDASHGPPPSSLRIVNYFGDQRFGTARHGEGSHGGFLAPLLIRGRFEEALRLAIAAPHRKDVMRVKRFKRAAAELWGDWPGLLTRTADARVPERRAVEHLADLPGDFRGAFAQLPYLDQQMCVDAYQSLLWNRVAARLIERSVPAAQTLTAAGRYGTMRFPHAAAVARELLDLDLPVPGETLRPRGPWRQAMDAVLAEEGLEPRDLRIPGLRRPAFREVPRPLFVHAQGFTMDRPEPDELQPKARRWKRAVRFTLPRGSYATVVLRALGQ